MKKFCWHIPETVNVYIRVNVRSLFIIGITFPGVAQFEFTRFVYRLLDVVFAAFSLVIVPVLFGYDICGGTTLMEVL